MDISEQINSIEKEIRETPYHKGTEQHIGMLRARLARLKDRLIEEDSKKGGGGSKGYAVKKQGDATVVLVGPPSVGKSTLLNSLTNAKSKVAPYAFTTVSVIPGMMIYKDARIQILDVPGLIKGAEEGKGRGHEVLSVVRGCDLLLIITDINDLEAFERINNTLEKNGVRVNKIAPSVVVEKKSAGGIIIHSNIKQHLRKEAIKDAAQQFGLRNAEITIKENLTFDSLIDAFSINRAYIPAIYVVNKQDLLKIDMHKRMGANPFHPTGGNKAAPILISCEGAIGIDKLKEKVWEKLDFVRVYLVRSDEEPNFENSLIMKKGQTLYDVAKKIGTEFAGTKTVAKIWGAQAKFAGQSVSLTTPVQEGMQVRFV